MCCPCPTPSQEQYTNNLVASRIGISSGGIFNLLSDGPTAQNVPVQAVTVNNASLEIISYNKFKWTHYFNGIYNYERSVSSTRNIESFLDEVAIWYDYLSHAMH